MKNVLKNILIVLAWLLIWQLASIALGNALLLVGPVEVVARLAADAVTAAFWARIAFSFLRIFLGFAIAFVGALVLGTLAARFSFLRDFLAPAVSFIKSVPVVCIIVLMLVWMGSAYVAVVAVALMVFPPVYFNYLEGLLQVDESLRQMLNVFHVSLWRRIRCYYWPAVLPFVESAARVVVGVGWKAGIAAEVIGIPNGSIGAGIYLSKLGLDTAGLFSWTIAIVLLSMLCEKLFLLLLDGTRVWSARVGARPGEGGSSVAAGCAEASSDSTALVAFDNVSFAYRDGACVLERFSYDFEAGGRYCIMAPSGSGKSTLLMLAARMALPCSGMVHAPERVSMTFQEDRLLDQLSAWDNVRMVSTMPAADLQMLKFDLDEILGQDSAGLSISSCSGGMKRKIALVRALSAPGGALLLDEPFAGMDDMSKNDAIALINRYLFGRTLLVATHDSDDVALMDATLVRLEAAMGDTPSS